MIKINTEGRCTTYSHFDNLPLEISEKIFSFLDEQNKVKLVYICKLFYKISSQDCLWLESLSTRQIKLIPTQARNQVLEDARAYCTVFRESYSLKIISRDAFDIQLEIKAHLKTCPGQVQEKLIATLTDMRIYIEKNDSKTKPDPRLKKIDRILQYLMKEGGILPKQMTYKSVFTNTIEDTISIAITYMCSNKTIQMMIEQKLGVSRSNIRNAIDCNHPEETILTLLASLHEGAIISQICFEEAIKIVSVSTLIKLAEKVEVDGSLLESVIVAHVVPEEVLDALMEIYKGKSRYYNRSNYIIDRIICSYPSHSEAAIIKLINIFQSKQTIIVKCLRNALLMDHSIQLLKKFIEIEPKPIESGCLPISIHSQIADEIILAIIDLTELKKLDWRMLDFAVSYNPTAPIIQKLINKGCEVTLGIVDRVLCSKQKVGKLCASDATVIMVIEAFSGVFEDDDRVFTLAFQYNCSEAILRKILQKTPKVATHIVEKAMDKNFSKELINLMKAKCDNPPGCLLM